MRVLVCGGRTYTDQDEVFAVLNRIHKETPITAIIHGCAAGADYLGGEWARRNNIPEIRFPANWAEHGRQAGPFRNQEMLDRGKPDLVVAFPGQKGTDDMKLRTMKAKVTLQQVPNKKRG